MGEEFDTLDACAEVSELPLEQGFGLGGGYSRIQIGCHAGLRANFAGHRSFYYIGRVASYTR